MKICLVGTEFHTDGRTHRKDETYGFFFFAFLRTRLKKKVKADGVRLPGFSSHEGGRVASPTHRPPFSPRKYSWYTFLLDAAGSRCCEKDYVNEKFQ